MLKRTAHAILAALILAGCSASFPPPASAEFTVADNYRPLRYAATNGQTTFSVTWPFENKADLRVYTNEDEIGWVLMTLDSAYTVTGAGNTAGGSVIFGDALDDTYEVVILRDDGIDRTVDFTSLTPAGVNLHLDRQTMQLQQVEDVALNRAIQLPKEDDYSGNNITTVLPSIIGNGGKAIVALDDESGVDWSSETLEDLIASAGGVDSLTVTNSDGVIVAASPANPITTTGSLAISLGNITPDSVNTAGAVTGETVSAYSVDVGERGVYRMYEEAPGVNYIGLRAPVSMSGNQVYDFPDDAGSAGECLTTNGSSGTPTLSWGGSYDIAFDFDAPPEDGAVYLHVFTRAVTCPDDFSGSEGHHGIAEWTGGDASVWTVKKNETTVGTMTVSVSAGNPVFTFATSGGATTFAAGDYLQLVADNTVGATEGVLAFTFACSK